MKEPLLQAVKKFLQANLALNKPILLGFSGGPDSLALLHLLLECHKSFSLDLHLAHVDHGWRQESRQQAKQLEEDAKVLKIPFHLHVIKKDLGMSNLEAKAREERLAFFKSLYQELDCQALFLAHHGDDVAETVLKRILEGSGLQTLGGIKPIAAIEGMRVLRPLLETNKEDLLSYLERKGLKGIQDPTNLEKKFLRGRMRTQIFPDLKRDFGKSFTDNLLKLSIASHELESYLEEKIEPYFNAIEKGVFGDRIDFTVFSSLPKIEVRFFLKKLMQQKRAFFSHQCLEKMVGSIVTKTADKSFISSNQLWFVDRGCLFIAKLPLPTVDDWTVTMRPVSEPSTASCWKSFFLKGEISAAFPQGEYQLEYKSLGPSIRKRFNEHRVPAFLRASLPFVFQDKKIVHEFLTGKYINNFSNEVWMQISLEFKKKL